LALLGVGGLPNSGAKMRKSKQGWIKKYDKKGRRQSRRRGKNDSGTPAFGQFRGIRLK
jgi:hypothetical protein